MTKPKNDFTPAKSSFDAFAEAMESGDEVEFLEVVPQFTLAEAHMFGPLCDCGQNLTKGPHVCYGAVSADQDDDDEDD